MNLNKILVITHKNCTDGCCSQAIFKSKYPNADYLELDHVNLDPSKDKNANNYIEQIMSYENSKIYIADFCLPYQMLDELLQKGNSIVVLDHHDSNIKEIEPFQIRKQKGEDLAIDINFCYENENSGAMLSWKYLYPDIEPPLSVQHVSHGDTWKFKLGERTKHFYAGIMQNHKEPDSAPKDFWNNLISDPKAGEYYEKIGVNLHAEHMEKVNEFASRAKPVILGGINGLMIEASKMLTSDLGNLLAKQCGGFGLVYFIEDSGIVRCSLRSIEPIKVNTIAEKFGGGGHPQAAAFRCTDIEEFFNHLDNECLAPVSRKLRN